MSFREFLHWARMKLPFLNEMLSPFIPPLRSAVRYYHLRIVACKSRRVKLNQVKVAKFQCSGNVVALLAVRNEIQRLPACLVHLRFLGVREFCVVDNGSTDGTLQYLEKQDDVNLYQTSESYKKAFYGITWINYLFHKHAVGRWALFVDADELLFLNSDYLQNSLNQYVESLDKSGQTYLYAPLVDLYQFSSKEIASVDDASMLYKSLRKAKHDIDGYWTGSRLSNGWFALRGGPRAGLAAENCAPNPMLVKYPLVKYAPSRLFTASSHEFMPSVLERHYDAGWLVHLKLGDDVVERHSDYDIEREHYGSGGERIQLGALENHDLFAQDLTACHFDGVDNLRRLEKFINPERFKK